jgi:hypothetical protein
VFCVLEHNTACGSKNIFLVFKSAETKLRVGCEDLVDCEQSGLKKWETNVACLHYTIILRDMTSCSPVESYQRFGGNRCLHPLVRRVAKMKVIPCNIAEYYWRFGGACSNLQSRSDKGVANIKITLISIVTPRNLVKIHARSAGTCLKWAPKQWAQTFLGGGREKNRNIGPSIRREHRSQPLTSFLSQIYPVT